MRVIAAVVEFERDLLIERTQSGIIRANAAGKEFGRPLVSMSKNVQRSWENELLA
jgi:putative DNA-invertase from lambdoid prophage Rac